MLPVCQFGSCACCQLPVANAATLHVARLPMLRLPLAFVAIVAAAAVATHNRKICSGMLQYFCEWSNLRVNYSKRCITNDLPQTTTAAAATTRATNFNWPKEEVRK